ncbi:MAG: hypothetical protein SV760_02020 [Halobacteria archaeon]|nr:hypothetical protein [Halobacteria archaeon]
MASVSRFLLYPRLVIVASYAAVVLGSLGLGMRIGGNAELDLLEVLPTVATVLIGIGILHRTYTEE